MNKPEVDLPPGKPLVRFMVLEKKNS